MSPQTDDSKPVRTEKPLLHRLFKTYPRQLWAALSHNFQWKLLALILAIGLWVALILQDPSLTRERIFTNVPLSITGSDTLRRNGFIVTEGLEEENAIVRLKVDVPQHEYNNVAYANYNARVDLSKVTEAGEQPVKVTATSSTTYGTVTDISPDSIPVVVDSYITNYRLPVHVEVAGRYPEGFYGTAPTPDVSTVAVSGPESVVSEISRIVLQYDVSSLPAKADSLQTALKLHYTDSGNNELDSSLVEATSGGVLLRSIVVSQELYPVRTLALNQTALTTGIPLNGYEVKSVTVSPSVIIAAGDETTLSTLDTLFLDEALDVTGRDTTFTAEIRITKPDNVVYMNADTVMMIVEIGAVLTTQTYESIPLSISGTPEGMSAATETAKVNVTLTGPMLLMEALKSSKIKASVSAEGLTPGVFDLPIRLTIDLDGADQFTYTVAPQSVSVTVSQK